MRITDVSAILYGYPLTRPIGDVHVPVGATRGADVAVEVHTDEGVTGVAVGVAGSEGAIRAFGPLLAGRDPRGVRAIWERMVAVGFKAGVSGPVKHAITALDCALWDLRARIHGVPLWKELGADTDRVRAYASGLDTPLDDDALAAFYAGMAARGVTTGKLKVGRDPDADERRLDLMARVLGGPSAGLIIDANEFWSPKQAVQRVRALERTHTFTWVEEPARRWDHIGLRQVSDAIDAPVATGENLNLAHEYVPLLTHGAVDVVQISVHNAGLTGALQVAELAYAFDRPVTMNNCAGRVAAHLAAALRHHTMMEALDIGRDAVLTGQPQIEDGHLVLGDAPGVGFTFDADLLARHRVDDPPAGSLAGAYSQASDAGLVG